MTRMTQEECAKKLAAWLRENAGCTYYTYYNSDDNLRGFGIDGEVDLMDMAIFVLDTLCDRIVAPVDAEKVLING